MITVQFIKLEDFAEELAHRKAQVQEGIVRVVTMAQGEQSPNGSRLHLTESGVLIGDQLHTLITVAPSLEEAQAQAAEVRKAAERCGLEVGAGRYT